jgi:hypothetical protein
MHIFMLRCASKKASWAGAADEPRERVFFVLHTLLYTHLIFNFVFLFT